jgi:hypothetical protein
MRVDPIDPRTARWEINQPSYRIYFWQRSSDHPDGGWASDEWRLSDAGVHEVLAWADEHADGRRVSSWIEIVLDGEPGLVRLSGWEPTRGEESPPWVRP